MESELLYDRVYEFLLWESLSCIGVEIAVGADFAAIGNVNIDAYHRSSPLVGGIMELHKPVCHLVTAGAFYEHVFVPRAWL